MPNLPRLEKLLAFVETLPADGIEMKLFAHPCGTPACLAGWATKVFPDDLILIRKDDSTYAPGFSYSIQDKSGESNQCALEEFFGLAYPDDIFGPDIPNHLAVSNLRSFIEQERQYAD